MIIAVFRSRVKSDQMSDYGALADEMEAIARTMPGFISIKGFVGEDGERLSFHEWESAAHLKAWREHPAHHAAQARGYSDFYSEFSLYVADAPRVKHFKASAET
ncbi:MAG: antibiotic biosynthesis monooxygenase [Alphaproteobacteria bacterium]|nr:antibiotic biosynthesis monooxygenase [Alphaproteobacteria bacterium]MDE2340581.1 antibiotic biosynthesis monooxygenase [Alphaproteobacteria bacterium]